MKTAGNTVPVTDHAGRDQDRENGLRRLARAPEADRLAGTPLVGSHVCDSALNHPLRDCSQLARAGRATSAAYPSLIDCLVGPRLAFCFKVS